MLALTGAKIMTMAGADIESGVILIRDGKIAEVGDSVAVPRDCETMDMSGKTILPGFIDVHCHIGLIEEGTDVWNCDANEMTFPATPQVRALDAINPADIAFPDSRAAGFTTVLVTPGSGDVICGQSVVIKTWGEVIDKMVLREPAGVKVAFGGNPKGETRGKAKNHPTTRMGVAATFRQAMLDAREYAKRRESGKETKLDLGKEALCKALRKEIPVRVHVSRSDDILTVIRLCKEFDLDFTMEHVTDGHLVADEIAESGAPCVIGPTFFPRGVSETRNLSFETAGALSSKGVKVALTTDHPFVPLRHARYQAAASVKAGMDEREAIKALTVNGAEIAGVSHRVGSIEKGKDADLAVLSGHPLELAADVVMTFIDGKVVYKRC